MTVTTHITETCTISEIYYSFITSTGADTALYIGDVKLELGNIPTPYMAPPIATELLKCMRYLYISRVHPETNDTTITTMELWWGNAWMFFNHASVPVPMRTRPVVIGAGYENGVNGAHTPLDCIDGVHPNSVDFRWDAQIWRYRLVLLTGDSTVPMLHPAEGDLACMNAFDWNSVIFTAEM
jgi:hypothetical protein